MSRLNKELGIAQGAGLMSTSLLGAGVFVVPALAASIAGHWSLLAWIILIVLALPVAFTFAMLGRYHPHAGGASHTVGQAMGKRFGNLTAFLFLSSLPVAVSTGLLLATGFWQALFELGFWEILAIKLGTMIGVLLLGLSGARICGNAQLLIAIFIAILIVLLWWGGDVQLSDGLLSTAPQDVPVGSVLTALGVMFWCFTGMEAFTHMGEEFKKPERDFPIALLIGVLLAGLVYWSCSVAVVKFHAYGSHATNTSSLPVMLAGIYGPAGKWLAAGIGYLACFAGINLYMQGFARLTWSLADEGTLRGTSLSRLAELSDKKIPVTALWVVVLTGMISSAFTHFAGISMEHLMCFANGSYVVIYLLSMLAGVKLLTGFKRGVAVIAVALCLIIMAALGSEAVYVLLMTLAFLGFDWLKTRAGTMEAG